MKGGRGRGARGGERREGERIEGRGKGYEGEEGGEGSSMERGWRWVRGRVASLRGGGKWSSTEPQGPYLYS